ncbi:heterokaryon incompatibility [Fusarium longipes]|uniref:Heterokaryon incompatibility n=1 Tax=Fusarium longipes TaxID=694270 RepID=A0A395SIW6_9HYPO|nr:heterokaryon incompatibility [Fusarium longipes]
MNWVNDCRSHHPECRQLQKDEIWRPTRLIDIGNEGDGKWKIVSLPDELESPPTYMTLSYTWGSAKNFRLLKTNLSSFQNGLPITDLPRTFQDACIVAWRFSVRYLWIDSLCIIQDCDQDWSRESAAMRLVYANALCNIAAAASSDPNGGLFRARNPASLQPIIVRAVLDETTPPKDYYAVDSQYVQRQLLDRELLKRGWVFQERLLCPRVLYFTEEQVFWECFTAQRCETFPHHIPCARSSKAEALPMLTDLVKGSLVVEDRPTLSITSRWKQLVQDYTNCKLTKASDRLFAIEGVADLFRNAFHDTYFFGLWRTELVRQLSHYVESPRKESSSQWIAPSWSWASLQSPIKFDYYSSLPDTTEHVSMLGVDPIHGILTLQGHIFEVRLNWSWKYDVVEEFALEHAQRYPDRVGIRLDVTRNVTLMPLISYEIESPIRGLGCLVLEPILVTTFTSYRRIAYMIFEFWDEEGLGFMDMSYSADGSATITGVDPSTIRLM